MCKEIEYLEVIDKCAELRFRNLAITRGLDPDDPWIGGYVAYEWSHVRHVFQAYNIAVKEMKILEFGCNYGASAIVLAKLGAKITAIDIDFGVIEMAKANAAMYGLQDSIQFLHVADTTAMPFDNCTFNIINCNSVLEYVPPKLLNSVQHEIDRVLKPQGLIFISGTSNRLWPVEMHSKKWLTNYIPNWLTKFLNTWENTEKGIFPWEIRYGFGRYQNLDLNENGISFFEAKRRMGTTSWKIFTLKVANIMTSPIRIWVGLLLPSISITLRKKSTSE